MDDLRPTKKSASASLVTTLNHGNHLGQVRDFFILCDRLTSSKTEKPTAICSSIRIKCGDGTKWK